MWSELGKSSSSLVDTTHDLTAASASAVQLCYALLSNATNAYEALPTLQNGVFSSKFVDHFPGKQD